MRYHRLLFVPLLLFLTGCGDAASEADPGSDAGFAAVPADHDHTAAAPANGHDHGHEDGHEHGNADPMPMLAIMRQLSVDLTTFMHALLLEDFAQMSESSAAIAHHAPTAPEDVRRIQAILGDEWQGFEEADHVVHEAAEELHHAVETRDFDAILARLDALQRGCVACHTAYRDRLLSEGSAVSRR